MNLTSQIIEQLRSRFPALARQVEGRPAIFFDGPAGTQVPQSVIDAICGYLRSHNANHGGLFDTSFDSDRLLDEVHRGVADFLGASDADCVAFGANMTSLTFALSRALAKSWRPGDEILLTRLEHDANFTPWVLAARDAGATVRVAEIRQDDCTLDTDDFRGKLNEKTKLVAVCCASNAVGTRNDVKEICRWAREAGALSFLDAVHFAPHERMQVEDWGCDLAVCSAYKFFGPHVGVLWGRRELLEQLDAYKLRTAPDDLPGKWMTGTQNHECLAGVLAAVDYMADVGRLLAGDAQLDRGAALDVFYRAVTKYERELVTHLISGLAQINGVKIWGIADPQRFERERLPTVSITHAKTPPEEIAARLGSRGIFVWHGNYYALPLTDALGVEPGGLVRIGLVHYNTQEEVDQLIVALREILN